MFATKMAAVIASRQNPLTGLIGELESRGIAVKLFLREDIRGYQAADAAAEELFKEAGKLDYLVIGAIEDESYVGKSIDMLTSEEYASWKYYSLG